MLNKRGEQSSDEFLGLVLAVVATICLAFLVIALWYSTYDTNVKSSENYLEQFKEATGVADSGGTGEFYMVPYGGQGTKFFGVYFGEKAKVIDSGSYFIQTDLGENVFCICYLEEDEEESVCESCDAFEIPFNDFSLEGGSFVINQGTRTSVNRATLLSQEYYFVS